MKTSKEIILITGSFPFGKGETFLESEIPILAKNFEKITIYPHVLDKLRRDLPSNVIVSEELARKFDRKIIWALFTFINPFFWQSLFRYRKDLSSTRSVKILFKFCAISNLVFSFFGKYKELNNSIFYTYWFAQATHGLLRLKISSPNSEIKVVSRAHRWDVYDEEADMGFWPFRSECLKSIDNLFIISDNGKTYLETKYGKNDNIVVSKLGVFDKGIIASRSSANNISVLSISNLVEFKRVHLIYQSLVAFAEDNPEIKLQWNHFGDGPLLNNLIHLIEENNIGNLVTHLHGRVENRLIYKFLENNPIDFFMNTSDSEGIPVSIMEVLSCGVPVIATNVGGTAEIVSEQNGKLLKKDFTIIEAKDAISSLLKSEYNPQQIRNIWKRDYNADLNFKEFSNKLIQLFSS